ncbi:protein transport protein Sec24C isoform 2 [Planoprotostelium fungivorum]|uniref:Protein transport protein Sec24C isoform 2 n=1 Tax=Planoprotostelium fungivorum TaxID=1890364 RepID=A0A2P6N8C7_9EUKA|nr:protein transport protein Sec24C isoform 2 [Planoprotostelium fungivorum]
MAANRDRLDFMKSLEQTQRRCDLILEFLSAKMSEDNRLGLWEYIRSVQYVLLVIDQYQRMKKDDRPRVYNTNIAEASLELFLYLEHICLPEHRRTFSRVLSSHRLCITLDTLHIKLYKEALFLDLVHHDGRKGTKSPPVKKEKEKDKDGVSGGRKSYSFAADFATFSHIIKDEAGQKFWEASFQGQFMVSWPHFLKKLSGECNGDIAFNDDDATRLAYVLDPSRTEHVSVFRFGNFLQTSQELQYNCFQGFMSHDEVSRLLKDKPPGTFVTRLSKTKPENIIVSHVDQESAIHHILMEAHTNGFITVNSSTEREVPSLESLSLKKPTPLREGLSIDVTRAGYFFGNIADGEANEILKKHPRGTFLVRFDANCLAISFVDSLEAVQHHRGLEFNRPPREDAASTGPYAFMKHDSHRMKSIIEALGTLHGITTPYSAATFDAYQPRLSLNDPTKRSKVWIKRLIPSPGVNQRADIILGVFRMQNLPPGMRKGGNGASTPMIDPTYDTLPSIEGRMPSSTVGGSNGTPRRPQQQMPPDDSIYGHIQVKNGIVTDHRNKPTLTYGSMPELDDPYGGLPALGREQRDDPYGGLPVLRSSVDTYNREQTMNYGGLPELQGGVMPSPMGQNQFGNPSEGLYGSMPPMGTRTVMSPGGFPSTTGFPSMPSPGIPHHGSMSHPSSMLSNPMSPKPILPHGSMSHHGSMNNHMISPPRSPSPSLMTPPSHNPHSPSTYGHRTPGRPARPAEEETDRTYEELPPLKTDPTNFRK